MRTVAVYLVRTCFENEHTHHHTNIIFVNIKTKHEIFLFIWSGDTLQHDVHGLHTSHNVNNSKEIIVYEAMTTKYSIQSTTRKAH